MSFQNKNLNGKHRFFLLKLQTPSCNQLTTSTTNCKQNSMPTKNTYNIIFSTYKIKNDLKDQK
jgi:hypothetical protein